MCIVMHYLCAGRFCARKRELNYDLDKSLLLEELSEHKEHVSMSSTTPQNSISSSTNVAWINFTHGLGDQFPKHGVFDASTSYYVIKYTDNNIAKNASHQLRRFSTSLNY